MTAPPDRPTCVVGAGLMGRDLAGLFAQAGYRVHLVDVDPDALTAAETYHRTDLAGTLRDAGYDTDPALTERISYHETVPSRDVFFALEAVTDRLDVKRRVVADLEAAIPTDAVLGTNTSSLSAADLAADASRPGRIVLFHFANPAISRDLVEIAGSATDSDAIEIALAVADAIDHWPAVLNRDRRGNGLSRLSAAVKCAGSWELERSSPAAVEDTARNVGFDTGPIALIDAIGIDVHLATVDNLADEYGDRFQPPLDVRERMEDLVATGALGRKTGRGFFEWVDGDVVVPEPADTADVTPIVAALVNEAHRMVNDGVADSDTIDEILRRGSGGDLGPFDLEATFGTEYLHEVLATRFEVTGASLFEPVFA